MTPSIVYITTNSVQRARSTTRVILKALKIINIWNMSQDTKAWLREENAWVERYWVSSLSQFMSWVHDTTLEEKSCYTQPVNKSVQPND